MDGHCDAPVYIASGPEGPTYPEVEPDDHHTFDLDAIEASKVAANDDGSSVAAVRSSTRAGGAFASLALVSASLLARRRKRAVSVR